MDLLAELYSAVTGNEMSAADLKKASERTWNLWNHLNCQAGFTRSDDSPPDIWFQPLKGPDKEYPLRDYFKTNAVTREDVEGMLDSYYEEHGWDKTTGCVQNLV